MLRKKGGIWQRTQTVHTLSEKITWVNKMQIKDDSNAFCSESASAGNAGKSHWEQRGVGA